MMFRSKLLWWITNRSVGISLTSSFGKISLTAYNERQSIGSNTQILSSFVRPGLNCLASVPSNVLQCFPRLSSQYVNRLWFDARSISRCKKTNTNGSKMNFFRKSIDNRKLTIYLRSLGIRSNDRFLLYQYWWHIYSNLVPFVGIFYRLYLNRELVTRQQDRFDV